MLSIVKYQQFSVIFLIILITFLGGGECAIKGGRMRIAKSELHLTDHLLRRYNHLVRPVQRPSDPLVVNFGITLIRILEVNEQAGTITTNIWQTMEWTDRNLRWDHTEYSNITTLRIPISRLWTPDIFALNNHADSYYPTFSTDAIVRSTGSVTHVAPYIMCTSCSYDPGQRRQNCQFKFGSWTSGVTEINPVLKKEGSADLSRFMPNKDWELLGFHGNRTEVKQPCCPELVVSLNYNLSILRGTNSTMDSESSESEEDI